MSQYLSPQPDALKKIKHIVVLMMENRSFDNMLGWLYDGKDPPQKQKFEGLNEHLWNPLNNMDSDGVPFVEQVFVRRNGQAPEYGPRQQQKKKFTEQMNLPEPDPGEGYKDTNQQLFEHFNVAIEYPPSPTNMGFVNNYATAMQYGAYAFGDTPTDPRDMMACYTAKQTPVLSALATGFAVCDHWHSSVPSQTLPNRDFVHAATSAGNVNNKPNAMCDAKTIYQQMQDAIDGGRNDLSWGIFSGESNGNLFSLTRTIMTQLHDMKFNQNFHPVSDFYKRAKKGTLPSYSFLEPQFSGSLQNDQHPSQDITPGEHLMAKVYNALTASPAWKNTLFVITYDEHGGCYDHVAPGSAIPPDGYPGTPGQDGFLFNRFGVRVPAVVISPMIQAGTIGRPAGPTPFDHTSIIKTVQNCFGLKGFLTQRDNKAPDLSCLLRLKKPRKDKPKVKALPLGKSTGKGEQSNDLNHLSAEVLEAVSKIPRKKNESLHDYLHRAFVKHFHPGN